MYNAAGSHQYFVVLSFLKENPVPDFCGVTGLNDIFPQPGPVNTVFSDVDVFI